MKKQSIWVFTALSLFQLVSCTQDADNLISEKNELKGEIVSSWMDMQKLTKRDGLYSNTEYISMDMLG